MSEDCIFCKIVSGEVKSEKVCESDNFIVVKDIRELTEGHSIVMPKRHYKTFLDIPSTMFGEMMELVKEAALNLMKENNSGGFNLHMNNFKVAGQEVEHAHLHILPRKDGDLFNPCA